MDCFKCNLCYVCQGGTCHHGHVKVGTSHNGKPCHECLSCGLKVENYNEMSCNVLPCYEGEVDWDGNVYFEVCDKCYFEELKKYSTLNYGEA